MPMDRNRSNKLHTFILGLIILLLLAWGCAGQGSDPETLPARDWNPCRVERLQAPAGDQLTFAVLGDSRSNPPVFDRVLKDMAGDPSLAFAIDTGDMVEKGTLEQFVDFFKQIQPYSRLPFLTAAGNHELGKNQDLTLYRKIFGPDYYAFQVKDHYFIVLNNNLATGLGEAQMAWLEDELRKSRAFKTRLVFFHYPLFDPRGGKFRHSMPEEAGRLLAALLSRYRVTHIFASHIHGYFTGDWDGVPFTITGGAGAPLAGADPAHFFYHYLKVTLTQGEVQVEVQRIKGEGDQ
jgi:serine/threonine-protein phosphatase CPPED1